MVDKKTITGFLISSFNLSEGEAKVYLKLVELQNSTVLGLSKATGLNRITVHGYVDSLIEKGLVSQTRCGARRSLVAESPSHFEHLLENMKKDVDKIEKDLPVIVHGIEDLVPVSKKSSQVEIKYYEGKKGVDIIYKEALKANEFRSYVNVKELSSRFPQNIELFLRAHRNNKKRRVWEIMEDSKEAKEYFKKMPKSRYYAKFIPKDFELGVIDYMVFDNKVAMVNPEERISGLLIFDENYYKNAKAIFKFVWQMMPGKAVS